MKKFTIFGLSVVIVAACILLLWKHIKISRDREDSDFRQSLAGAWSWELDNMRCTNMVAPDGSFTSQLMFSHSDHTNTYQMAGTWQIKDGRLMETVTSDSNKSAQVPRTHTGRIVRVNADEFVVTWQSSTNKSVWQRVHP
jgi:hypothetical protein